MKKIHERQIYGKRCIILACQPTIIKQSQASVTPVKAILAEHKMILQLLEKFFM